MIRRISKHNDLKDIIKSCPSGVIDDIYAIEYYIQGHNDTIQASFTKTGQVLEVVLPSTDLETLPNGILMRRAFYKVLDASYPDGYYNLEFEDNMNVWIGENESEEPVIPEYVTEEELTAALGDLDGNTVEDYVVEVGHRVLDTVAETYATRAWVSSKRYASIPWVEEQGYLTGSSTLPADQITLSLPDLPPNVEGALIQLSGNIDTITTEDIPDLDSRVTALEQSSGSSAWGNITGTITDQTDLVNYVDQAIEDAISGSDVPLPENVVEYEDTTSGWMSVLSDYDDDCDILKRPVDDEYTGGGVHEANTKNLVLGYHRTYDEHSTEQDITLIEVGRNSNGTMTLYKHVIIDGYEGDNNGHQLIPYVTSEDLSDYVSRSYLSSALSGYATQSWVQSQGYLVNDSVDPYATCGWVQTRGYLTTGDLSGYATESWVQNQGYLTSSSTLPASQITCNISGDVFDFDDVDEGLTALVNRVEDQMDDITSLDTRVTDLENAGYATQTWVQQQGYITSSALSGYATESWATNQFLEESKVWSGTETQWNALTPAQQASYTIALITQ